MDAKKKFKLVDLEKLGWLNAVADGLYILNTSLPKKILSLSEEDSDLVKKSIKNLRNKAMHSELQKFLYFGGEGFQGMRSWVNFGEDREDSWLYKLQEVGKSALIGIQSGKSIEDAIFHRKNLRRLKNVNDHLEICFDAALRHIEKEFTRKLEDLKISIAQTPFSYLTIEIKKTVRNTLKQLRVLDSAAYYNEESGGNDYIESNKIFRSFIKKCQDVIKITNDRIYQIDRKLDSSLKIKATLDNAYTIQDKYIDETLKVFKKLTDIKIQEDLSSMVYNLENELEFNINETMKSILKNIEANPYDIRHAPFNFDILKQKSKKEDSTKKKSSKLVFGIFNTLEQTLTKKFESYVDENIKFRLERLTKVMARVEVKKNTEETARLLHRSMNNIENEMEGFSMVLETAQIYFTNITKMISHKFLEILSNIEKGVVYARMDLKFIKEPIDSYRKLFRDSEFGDLFWAENHEEFTKINNKYHAIESKVDSLKKSVVNWLDSDIAGCQTTISKICTYCDEVHYKLNKYLAHARESP